MRIGDDGLQYPDKPMYCGTHPTVEMFCAKEFLSDEERKEQGEWRKWLPQMRCPECEYHTNEELFGSMNGDGRTSPDIRPMFDPESDSETDEERERRVRAEFKTILLGSGYITRSDGESESGDSEESGTVNP